MERNAATLPGAALLLSLLIALVSCADDRKSEAPRPRGLSAEAKALLRRADKVCERFRAQLGPDVQIVGTGPDTVGNLNRLVQQLGKPPLEPWASMDPDQFLARCGYGVPPPTSVVCPDGSTAFNPGGAQSTLNYIVDERGRSTEDPGALPLPTPTDPCQR